VTEFPTCYAGLCASLPTASLDCLAIDATELAGVFDQNTSGGLSLDEFTYLYGQVEAGTLVAADIIWSTCTDGSNTGTLDEQQAFDCY